MERQTHEPHAPAEAPSERAAPTLVVRSYGLSDRGRVRTQNEDQFLIAELAKAMQVVGSSVPQPRTAFSNARAHLFAVADGMGGHRAGAQASALAVTTLEGYVLESLQWFSDLSAGDQTLLRDFQAALVETDARLFAVSEQRPELSGMGTTLTVAWCQDAELCVLHVGDSRCYIARGDTLHQLTQDHTLVGELRRRGAITEEEASGHTLRHVITNAVGGPAPGVNVEVQRAHLEPGDALLLCSDGLTEMVPDDAIREMLAAEPDPKAACERLVAAALAAGGRDNVTVVVARFDPLNAPPDSATVH
jgi:serine/threonine protein phosphatase PrpC